MALTKITGEGVGAVDNLTVDTNTLVVDAANNRVGIGEASPAVTLEASNASNPALSGVTNRNPIIQLTNTDTGYVAGNATAIDFATSLNYTNASIICRNDNAGAGYGGVLIFATSPTSGDSLTERMRIDNDGTVYLNHSVTQYGSYVGNINVGSGGITTGFGTSNGKFRNIYSSDSGGSIILKFHSGSNVASLSTGGAWTDASDASYKRDIEDLSYGISTVKALQPRLYHLVANENDDDPQIGFVAQEIEAHVPEVVVSDEDKDGSIKKGVSYGRMAAVLTKALQEAIAKIETLETEMTALKARVTALEDA